MENHKPKIAYGDCKTSSIPIYDLVSKYLMDGIGCAIIIFFQAYQRKN